MAGLVDAGSPLMGPSGSTHRIILVVIMLIMTLGGVFGFVVAIGIVSDDALREVGSTSDAPTVGVFFGVYAGWMASALIGAYTLEYFAGLDAMRGIVMVCGIGFVVAGTGRPWWFYGTVRRLGWFALIWSETAMKALLIVLGLALIVGAFFEV